MVQLGRWYVSVTGKVLLTEEFIGDNEVRACADNNLTEILSKHELETAWRLVNEKDSAVVEPAVLAPIYDVDC